MSNNNVDAFEYRLQDSVTSLFTPTAVAGVGFSTAFVCLSICTISQQTDASRITKLDIEMFHDESRKTHLFWNQKVKGQGQSHKQCRRGSLHSCECSLLVVSSAVACCYVDLSVCPTVLHTKRLHHIQVAQLWQRDRATRYIS